MKVKVLWVLLLFTFLFTAITQTCPVVAAQQGDYLNYQEPRSSGYSWLSTLAYVFSLMVMFAIVLALAYMTSRFFGQRMGKSAITGDNRIIVTLSMGPNRGVSVVEIAGKFLVLGVTEHNINLLQEINDPEQIEKLKEMNQTLPLGQFDAVFQRHLVSLQQMTQKFPGVFGGNKRGDEDENSKR